MSQDESSESLASGEAWIGFCEAMKEAGLDLLRPTAPRAPVDLAEGYRFLTRMLRSAFELIMESGNAALPALTVSLHETMKIGWDNPDNIHLNAYISDRFEYRLWGVRGEAHTVSLAVYGGSYGKGQQGRSTIAFVDLDDLEIAEDGRFEVVLSAREGSGNRVRLAPGATTLMIRQTFWDRRTERPGEFHIERLDSERPPPLDPAFVASALRRVARYVRGSNRMFFDYSDHFIAEVMNRFEPSDPEAMARTQGIPYNQLSSGWWRLAPEEAAVIDFVPPPGCPYWMFVLSNYWGESFDYRHHRIHTNARQAARRADGSVRLVVAHEDPVLADANWIETAGHGEGVWQFRWYRLDSLPPCPEPRLVPLSELAGP
jgi:hypothetical protein